MTRFHLQDVVDSTGAILVRGEASDLSRQAVANVCTDSRTLAPGEMFLALDGPNFRGNRFAADALRRGAVALLLRDEPEVRSAGFEGEAPVLVHPEPRRALADLAGWYRSTLDACVLGITGSCGKTTTKNIVAELVAPVLPTVASPSSFNNDIGVPLTLLQADRSTRLLAVEMGTNHPGEIALLCRIARPSAGIITNVGAAHLEGLGSLEGVAQEKGDLAASLPSDGFVVLNADCRFTPSIRSRTSARVLTFSVQAREGEEGDLAAREPHFHRGGTTFLLGERRVESPLLGTHNVQNLLAALCACVGLGLDLDQVLEGVPRITGGSQRMERHEVEGLTVIDDSYNANPDALRAALRVLADEPAQRRVLVLGDMAELGDLGAEMHHKVGVEAARGGVDVLVCIGELARAAAAGALEAGLSPKAVVHLEGTDEAVDVLPGLVQEGDVVLVKGSRRMELERVVARLVEPGRGAR